jgi:hypothetical protein
MLAAAGPTSARNINSWSKHLAPSSVTRRKRKADGTARGGRESRDDQRPASSSEAPALSAAMMLRAAGKRLVAVAAGGHQHAASPAAVVAARSWYHARVVDHYNNPRNVGAMDKDDPDVGTGLVGAPACGDVMKLQIRVDDGSGKIVDARFKTFGCGSAIASSSVGEPANRPTISFLPLCVNLMNHLFLIIC